MGAWGHGILENDRALDAIIDINEAIYGKYEPEKAITKKGIERYHNSIANNFATTDLESYQALGQCIVDTNAFVRRDVINHCIKCCTDPDLGSWEEPKAREKSLDDLKTALEEMLPTCNRGTNLQPNPRRVRGA